MNRCQTCGDSFTRYSEQNSQFLLLFWMLLWRQKTTTKSVSFHYLIAYNTIFIIYLWWPFSFFFRRYLLQSHAMTVHQVEDDLNSQIFGSTIILNLHFQFIFRPIFSEIHQWNHCCMSEKNWQAQPLKYKCKCCKGDRFRKEFETQVILKDIVIYIIYIYKYCNIWS